MHTTYTRMIGYLDEENIMSTLKVDAIRHNSATSDAITTALRWNLHLQK